MIECVDLSCGYDDVPLLQHMDLAISRGSFNVLLGPNGCGKSTLIRTVAKRLPPVAGQIYLQSRNIQSYGAKEYARKISVLPQNRPIPALSVEDLVAHGRYPHLGFYRRPQAEDREICLQAMEDAGVLSFRHRNLSTLSGGQRQRAYIAMALAQNTDVLLLDEPTTYLDIGAQFEILDLLRQINVRGRTILMALHDLSHALNYADRLLVLADGGIAADGTPEQIFQNGVLSHVFQVSVRTHDGHYYCCK